MTFTPIRFEINDSLRYDNLNHTAEDSDIWTILYYAGYLTRNMAKEYYIPNTEVYSEWVTWLLPGIGKKFVEKTLIQYLLRGEVEMFSRELPTIILGSLSYFEVGGSISGKNTEAFYHAFCLGLFFSARDHKYDIKSNREAGTGRYDVMLIPRTRVEDSFGVIIEFKVAGEGEDLQNTAMKGLKQVHDKQYRAGCPSELTKLCIYGIAFKGKNCCVVGESWHKDGGGVWTKLQ